MKRKVVITGVGILSSLGNSFVEVTEKIRLGESGIVRQPYWEELGLRVHIGGSLSGINELKKASGIPKIKLAGMSEAGLYCALAANDAIDDSGLSDQEIKSQRTSCIVGSGSSCVNTVFQSGKLTYGGKPNRLTPYTVVRSMASSCSANIANVFGLRGRSYSISSACTTATHNIGHAFELIQNGVIDTAIAGGGEGLNELITNSFCALRVALSSKFQKNPKKASRPYDIDRDGFVISGGAGIVILETLDVAKARGASIYAEIVGYGANSDGFDIVLPDPEGNGASECMNLALTDAGIPPWEIDYLNTHGTSTIAGDIAEIIAIRKVFGEKTPFISSTKSMGGHAIGASGAHELIHCLGMLKDNFISPSINIEKLDPECEGVPIVTKTKEHKLNTVMSNTFGFGGTNGSLIVSRYL